MEIYAIHTTSIILNYSEQIRFFINGIMLFLEGLTDCQHDRDESNHIYFYTKHIYSTSIVTTACREHILKSFDCIAYSCVIPLENLGKQSMINVRLESLY